MIKSTLPILLIAVMYMILGCKTQNPPLSLHPENPHYFMFRGKPTVLIGSTEHYGAVINLDFDYIKYLDELKSKDLNVTRTFTGIYLEPQGAFGIANNTLAPGKDKFICPWARSNEPGYANGGNKFDLTKWDENYFTRLKDFIAEAGKRNIVVELDLFSNFYDTLQWKLSPLYISNNINQIGNIKDQKEILSLKHPEIIEIQEKMVKKILEELNEFDNLYYEICNEPYFGDIEALNAWEKHITQVTVQTENALPNKHLISNNIGTGSKKIENPNDGVSIFNFHYAKPPVTVQINYDLNKVTGDNETGFNGIEDVNYRTEGWDFLVAGGGLYNNLDYSFTTNNEEGNFIVAPGQPGGGGVNLRSQLQILKKVFDELDFVHMKPNNSLIKSKSEDNTTARLLAKEGEQYLLYINNSFKNENNYSLRYTGSVSVPVSGNYRFYMVSDDGVKLWVDNKLVISNWNDHASTTDSVSIDLKANTKYSFKLEYYQGGGGSELNIKWISPDKPSEKQQITNFISPDGKTPGLLVEKFSDITFMNKSGENIVKQITPVGFSTNKTGSESTNALILEIPQGNYKGEWIDTKTGKRNTFEIKQHKGGELSISRPAFKEDIALIINKI
ncbi:MAG: PA14 domain-containing protein [Bacteroidales bacterium]